MTTAYTKLGTEEDSETLSIGADLRRVEATRLLDPETRSALGQFLTPSPTATLMASMFRFDKAEIRLLDPGAGVGSLTAAWVEQACALKERPSLLDVTAYEIDGVLKPYLEATLRACAVAAERAGIELVWRIETKDFVRDSVSVLTKGLFAGSAAPFDAAILNPPYRKLASASVERQWLRSVGIETTNLYAAFLALAVRRLSDAGQVCAITPRSFCNGPYFKHFRQMFLSEMAIRRLHLYNSRGRAFSDDDVLQENVIVYAEKSSDRSMPVQVSTTDGPEDPNPVVREMPYAEVVDPHDRDSFVRIVPDETGRRVTVQMKRFARSLAELGLTVSTGRVVDFRARAHLRRDPEPGTAPLIYPTHFADGFVSWPKLGHKKPNAIVVDENISRELLIASDVYVLAKRFSAKEEPRRLVAAVYDPSRLPPAREVGFENHLNYFHEQGKGLPLRLARGLALYLNSGILDQYFRLFNGHTQVNATDLRTLPYPERDELEALSDVFGGSMPNQEEIDAIMARHFFQGGHA